MMTELETKIIEALKKDIDFCWVYAVIERSGIDPKIARGAISSLVQKGVISVEDYEGNGNADDMAMYLINTNETQATLGE